MCCNILLLVDGNFISLVAKVRIIGITLDFVFLSHPKSISKFCWTSLQIVSRRQPLPSICTTASVALPLDPSSSFHFVSHTTPINSPKVHFIPQFKTLEWVLMSIRVKAIVLTLASQRLSSPFLQRLSPLLTSLSLTMLQPTLASWSSLKCQPYLQKQTAD